MILRVDDGLRNRRRFEFPKPAVRVTGLGIRYLSDVEAWRWLPDPERVEWLRR